MTLTTILLGIAGFFLLAFLIVCCALWSARRSAPWLPEDREFRDEDVEAMKRKAGK